MYLINVQTLELEEFIGSEIPPYAILSHRWGSQELNFKDMRKQRCDEGSLGYKKLLGACRLVIGHGHGYLWIDTCCIDKKSSAELSEAINSMYSWYEKAEFCIAYLEDVSMRHDGWLPESPLFTENVSSMDNVSFEDGVSFMDGVSFSKGVSFSESVWFTRAWTLQELIAPKHVEFYDFEWNYIGDRIFKAKAIQARTSIPEKILQKSAAPSGYAIAVRMSWASKRVATRSEDIAYSLLGIFDVNMPLLYGEGAKAFVRLQEEIIRHDNDLTVLIWNSACKAPRLFANSPDDFQSYREARISPDRQDNRIRLTNGGLEVECRLGRCGLGKYAITVGERGMSAYMIILERDMRNSTKFYRIGVEDKKGVKWGHASEIRRILISSERLPARKRAEYAVRVQSTLSQPIVPMHGYGKQAHFADQPFWSKIGPEQWRYRFDNPSSIECAMIKYSLNQKESLYLEITFDFDSRPCLLIKSHPEALQTYKNLIMPSAYNIADLVTDEANIVGQNYSHDEVMMHDIVDNRTGHVSYFFRSTRSNVCAQIPQVTPLIHPIRVRFYMSRELSADVELWTLSLSATSPSQPMP